MLRLLVFLTVALPVTFAFVGDFLLKYAPERETNLVREERAIASRVAVTSMTNIQYLVAVCSCDKNTNHGVGAIVSNYWIVTRASVLDAATTTGCVIDSAMNILTDGNIHRIKELKKFTGAGDVVNNIGVARVCPAFNPALILPAAKRHAATDIIVTNTDVVYYEYLTGTLFASESTTGDSIPCSGITNWDVPTGTQICLQNHGLTSSVSGDLTVEKSTGKVLGFRVTTQDLASNTEGEIVLNLAKYYDSWVVSAIS